MKLASRRGRIWVRHRSHSQTQALHRGERNASGVPCSAAALMARGVLQLPTASFIARWPGLVIRFHRSIMTDLVWAKEYPVLDRHARSVQAYNGSSDPLRRAMHMTTRDLDSVIDVFRVLELTRSL